MFVLEFFSGFYDAFFRVLNPKTVIVKICCETGDSVFGLFVLVRFDQLGTGSGSEIFTEFVSTF